MMRLTGPLACAVLLGGGVSAIVYKRGADGRWRLVERDMLAIS
ncbi:hypothetical protein FHR20_000695 [Sphingomonas leidyi]|uniref:Uncharacterized protein n=1 Tax=Sphingomonas leidyi TaxID=68569 RepID=A0A7X5ZUJ3_9SPHN|nr:hypothetical protein [Sphingomonas leidyi]